MKKKKTPKAKEPKEKKDNIAETLKKVYAEMQEARKKL